MNANTPTLKDRLTSKIGGDVQFSTNITLLFSILVQQREHSREAWEKNAAPGTHALACYCDDRYQAAIDRLIEGYAGLHTAYCRAIEDIDSIARTEKSTINRDAGEVLTDMLELMSPAAAIK